MAEVAEQIPQLADQEESAAVENEESMEAVDQASEPASSSPDEPADVQGLEQLPRRLWLVRLPKPPESMEVLALEREVAAYTRAVRLLNESAAVKKLARDDARKETQAAREAYRRCRDALGERSDAAAPLRDAVKGLGTAVAGPRRLREQFQDLSVWSETELDERIETINHRLQHESPTLREEKKLVGALKALQRQRPRVKEFEAAAAESKDPALQAETAATRAMLGEVEDELRALREERAASKSVLDGFWEAEQAINAEVDAVLEERKRLKSLQDAAYAKLSKLRDTTRSKKTTYFDSRRYSSSIRDALRAGRIKDAIEAAAKQVNEQIAVLSSNPEARREYVSLFAAARARDASEREILDRELKTSNQAAQGTEQRTTPGLAEDQAKQRAETLIANVLREKRAPVGSPVSHHSDWAGSRGEATSEDDEDAKKKEDTVVVVEKGQSSKKHSKSAAAGASAAGPSKTKSVAAKPVAVTNPTALGDFELPAFLSAREQQGDEPKAPQREAELARQKALQAAAERRKAKKQERAKRAAEQRAQRKVADKEVVVLEQATTAVELPGTEEDDPSTKSESSEPAAPVENKVTRPRHNPKANPALVATNAPLPVAKAVVGKPVARRPRETKRPLWKTLRQTYREHEMAIVLAMLALVLLFVLGLSLTA